MNSPTQSDSPWADESVLVQRLRKGDDAAYEQVMRELGARLFATAQRLLHNDEDAQEALQDAFLSAFRGINKFDGNSKLSTWLHRIVVNASLMKLRSKRRRPENSLDAFLTDGDSGNAAEHPALAGTTPVDGAIDDELRQLIVREQIDLLPDEYRTVLLLRDIEELDTNEAATVLGISVSAVKTRLHRARLALRDKVRPILEGTQVDQGRSETGT